MAVLPREATLVSFAVLLVIVLIITTFIAFNLRNILSMVVRRQLKVSNFIYSSKQHLKIGKCNISSILAFFYSLIALPANELAYITNLIKPVRARNLPWFVEVRFSYCKLVGDLVRLLLLPMWMVLSLPYFVVLGVMTLFRAIWKLSGCL